jgi:hypothetical protein
MSWTLLPYEKNSQYALNRRRLSVPQIQPGCDGEEKDPYLCWELNPGHPSYMVVTILTERSQLYIVFVVNITFNPNYRIRLKEV